MRRFLRSILLMAALAIFGNLAHAQLNGSYSITGASSTTTFVTLADAIAALNAQGISGAVTINLPAGFTETAPTGGYALGSVALNASLSATNTLTFQKSGTGTNPLLTAYTGGTGTPATAVQDGIWSLRGTDYVIIDGINLTDPNTVNPATMEYGYALYKASATDGCQNVTIKNCTVTLKRINDVAGTAPMVDGSTGIIVMSATAGAATTVLTPTSAAGSNSNNKFYSNTIQNCNTGIALIGFADASPFALADQGNDIGGSVVATGNNILNFGGAATPASPAVGIRTLAQYDLNVSFNTINNNNGSGVNHTAAIRGIYTNTASGASETVNNNTITIKGGGTTAAITAIENAAGGTGTNNTVSINNNTITNCSYTTATSGAFTGITSSASAATLNINSNNLTANATSAASGTTTMISNSGSVVTAINLNGNNINGFTYSATSSGAFLGVANTGAASNAALSISTNNFQSIVHTAVGSGTETYVSNTSAGPLTYAFNGNTFTNLVANTTASVTFLANAVTMGSTAVSNMNNNSIVTAYNKAGVGGTIAIHTTNSSTSAGAVVNFLNNNFSNITFTGATTFSGYNNTDGGSPTKNVNGNIFNNITGGTNSISVINLNFNGPISIANNTITNVTGQGNITAISTGANGTATSHNIINNTISGISSTGAGGAVIGITCASPATVAVIDSNKISGLSTTASAAVNGIISTATTANIFQNNINDLSGAAVGSTVLGISIAGTTNTAYNNFISNLRAPADTLLNSIIGLNVAGGTTENILFNTIYLGSAASLTGGASFGGSGIFIASTSPSVLIKNNIINVKGSAVNGYFAAIKRTSGTAGTRPANLNIGTNIYNAPYIYGEGTTLSTATNVFYVSGGTTGTADPTFNSRCGSLYKAFMADLGSAFEDNLTAGTVAGTFTPAGLSYAEGNAAATTPAILTDFSNAARGTLPDMGALQFTGTVGADVTAPVIVYTALPLNTYCTTPPTLTATITDASGVNTTAGTKPRLYFKKSTENNVFGGINAGAVNGWKYVEGTNSGSTFTFVLDYALLNSPVVAGDSITYFVVAQDNATIPNVGTNLVGLPSGYCPASVNLTVAASPIAASPIPNGYRILTIPAIAITASPNSICTSGPTTLSVTTALPNGTNIQWQQDNGTATFVNIAGATGTTYTTGILTANNNFRAQVICNGAPVASSTPVPVLVLTPPTVATTTPATRCGIGTVTLGATTTNTGAVLNWYSAATGGISLGRGTSFITPTLSGTTTFYVGAGTPTSFKNLGNTTIPTATGASAERGIVVTASQSFTLDSAQFYSTVTSGTIAGTASLVNNTTGTTISTSPFSFTAGSAAQWYTVKPAFALAAGTTYRLLMSFSSGSVSRIDAGANYSSLAFNNLSPVGTIISGYDGGTSTTSYNYYHNIAVSTVCESSRTAVVATVNVPPAITLSSPQAGGVCAGTTVTVTASTASTASYKYYWVPTDSGSTITRTPTATTTFILTATDTSTGATAGCVVKDSIKININPKPALPTITPNPATICEGSSQLLTVNGASNIIPKVIGTGTNVITSSSTPAYNPAPYSNYYGGEKHQMLIRATELTAAGLTAGSNIGSIGFSVESLGSTFTGSLNAFQINMGHTTTTALTSSAFLAVPSLVYGPTNTAVFQGIVTHILSTPFVWNGTDNIVIQTSYSNGNTGGSGDHVNMYSTTTTFNATNYYRADGVSSATILSSTTVSGVSTERPNMILGVGSQLPVKWININGLYKNPALTQALTATDSISPVYASPVTNQTYRAFVNLQGCVSDTSAPATVTVVPKFTPTITVVSPSTVTCFPGTITLKSALQPSSGYTYQWILGTTDIAGATDSVYNAPVSGAYKLRVTARTPSACSYTTSAATNVTINPLPPTNITVTGSLIFCTGGSVSLAAPTGTNFGYMWNRNTIPLTTDTLRTYTATTAGDYAVTVTNRTTGCVATTAPPTTVTIATPAAPIAAAAATNTICDRDTLRLRTNNAPGLTYQWYRGGSATSNAIAGATDSVYKAFLPGTYYVIVSVANQPSCNTTSAGLTVTVNPLPIAAISASSAATTFCTGGNVVLTATPASYNYQWRLGTANATAPSTGQTYTATAGGSYTAIVTDPTTGCVATSNAIAVTVNPLPTATATAATSATICSGSSVVINANTGTGLTYQWFNGTGLIPGATAASYTANAAGAYSVRVTNANNCVATSTAVNVVVNPIPAATITPGGSVDLCTGDTVTLVGPTGTGYTYQWKLGTANAAGSSTSKDYKATAAGAYTVVVTASSCPNTSAATTVNLLPVPTAVMTPTAATTGCDTVRLTSSNTGVTYQWRFNGNNIIGATTNSYVASASGNYSLRVTSPNGCGANTASTSVTINQRPGGTITSSSPLSFCEGGAVALNANAAANQTYEWRKNGTAIAGATTNSYITTQSGSYTVNVTNTVTGCNKLYDPVTVRVNPLPTPTIVYDGTNNQLSVLETYPSYRWYKNSQPIPSAQTNVYTPTVNGAYSVIVTDTNGCTNVSQIYFINTLGITNATLAASVRVYPNPTTGMLYVNAPAKVNLSVRDVSGKVVLSADNATQLDVEHLADGMYLLYVSDTQNQLIKVEKITKSAK